MVRKVLLFLSLVLLFSCKKEDTSRNKLLEQYFENNVLNTPFIVSFARDNTTDLTSNYDGYTFVLLKEDFYHGPMKVTKNGTEYTGSWSSNDDYGKLVITLSSPPSEFDFLSREWRFTSKNLPTLKLAPWGSTEDIELFMLRQ